MANLTSSMIQDIEQAASELFHPGILMDEIVKQANSQFDAKYFTLATTKEDKDAFIAAFLRGMIASQKAYEEELNTIMTAAEAAETFELAEATVRQAINRGQIPARKSAGTWLIRREDAEKKWRK